MNLNIRLRQIHHWGSIIIMLQMGLIIGAGLFLMLKKEIPWIQPETSRAEVSGSAPNTRLSALYEAAYAIPELDATAWTDFERVDIKPDKGVVKFVAPNRWEAQISLETLEPVRIAYRRSDLIESLHDGSFFADWVKLYIFFPSGLVLLTLWATGVYLFFLPHVKRAQRRRRKQKRAAAT